MKTQIRIHSLGWIFHVNVSIPCALAVDYEFPEWNSNKIGQEVGYLELRDDLDKEFEEEAEKVLDTMDFTDGDTPEDVGLYSAPPIWLFCVSGGFIFCLYLLFGVHCWKVCILTLSR